MHLKDIKPRNFNPNFGRDHFHTGKRKPQHTPVVGGAEDYCSNCGVDLLSDEVESGLCDECRE